MNESSQAGRHANESLRFVQLSDLHLSSIEKPKPFDLLNKRILGYLSWLRKRRHTHQRWVLDLAVETIRQLQIDHYAITGDLTHIGLKSEFTQVKQWLEQLDHAENITLVPGNHDLYVNEQWQNSFVLWQNYLYGDNHSTTAQHDANISNTDNSLDRLNQLYPIIRIRKNVAFIGINSVFNAPWFRATGLIDDQQLKRLETILQQQQLNNYCKVLLIHHPITLTYTPPRKCLLNYQTLVSLLEKYPVDIVLHGHGHHSSIESIPCKHDTNTPVIGMSSSSSVSQVRNYKAEFLLFEVAGKPNQWHISKQNYSLDMNSRMFIPNKIEVVKQN